MVQQISIAILNSLCSTTSVYDNSPFYTVSLTTVPQWSNLVLWTINHQGYYNAYVVTLKRGTSYYRQPSAYKFENLNAIQQFLEKHNLLKFIKEEIII